MATTANLPPGAVAANGTSSSSAADPFTNPPVHAHPAPLRYSAFDGDDFTMYSTNSPASARRALEAHLKDTDRRIQDASRLGTTLVQQRRDLTARLKDVEQVQSENEVPADLREKLVELEREYNEVGKESARAFLPKSRVTSDHSDHHNNNSSTAAGVLEPPAVTAAINASILTAQGRESPTKMSAPSRRQRNQPTNRIHDIEFATEISTSLLAQVRQLQAALAEKDSVLRETVSSKAQIESETMALIQRIRHMDESEQKYKDENWNLEMKLQELEASYKASSDKEARLVQSLKAIQVEKAAKERELDDLKSTHDRTIDDHTMSRKVQEADLHGLRREVVNHEAEKQKLHSRIDELTSQNTELAKAVGYRWNSSTKESDTDFMSAEEGIHSDDQANGHSDPPSPIKGTPARHGMLETETLKSSLNHAHRMIQNLKNNIHREKTEKIELKRMLQDARDEIEARRDSNTASSSAILAKKRREQEAAKSKKPIRIDRLGANRGSTIEVVDDGPDWEDAEGERTPSRSLMFGAAAGAAGYAAGEHFSTDTETDASFETADERHTATESEAFATGAEDFDQDTEGDLTETEDGPARSNTVRVVSGISSIRGDRRSFYSTASTSGDDDDDDDNSNNHMIRTPVQPTHQQPKYKVRLNRASKRVSSTAAPDLGAAESPVVDSPVSVLGPSDGAAHHHPMQSLEDELDGFDDEAGSSVEGTPLRHLGGGGRTLDEEMFEEGGDGTPGSTRAFDDELPVTPSRRSVVPVASAARGNNTPLLAVPSPSLANSSILGDDDTVLIHSVDTVVRDDEASASETAAVSPSPAAAARAVMVDAGVMTEPWEPAPVQGEEKSSTTIAERAEGIVGGALVGLGLGGVLGLTKNAEDASSKEVAESSVESEDVASKEPVESVVHTAGFEIPAEKPAEPAVEPVAVDAPVEAAVPSKADEVEQHITTPSHDDSRAHKVEVSAPLKIAVPFTFSTIMAQEFEPELEVDDPATPFIPRRSSKRPDGILFPSGSYSPVNSTLEEASEIERSRPATAVPKPAEPEFSTNLPDPFVTVPSETAARLKSNMDSAPAVVVRPEHNSIVDTAASEDVRDVLGELSPNVTQRRPVQDRDSMLPVTKPLNIKKAVVDEGSQTMISSEEIDNMLRSKAAPVIVAAPVAPAVVAPSMRDASVGPITPPKIVEPPSQWSADPATIAAMAAMNGQTVRRPTSAGSTRSKTSILQPPLPSDHTERIAAAVQQTPAAAPVVGSMGPPLMPASAYKVARPRTPSEKTVEFGSVRDGTTPRPGRGRDSHGGHSTKANHPASPGMSHRTSVSSFASELDNRFNIGQSSSIMYPNDVDPATDPRMIQAITQTMIGEYLWKYTRKAGRSETSSTRHRRFFWVHPYTRTLYWSENDPSTAGKNMLKAKSVAIDAVRVVTDDNVFPPGLHRKSLVVVTPGRDIVFTAPSSQRHETWFNALSYLLLKTEAEREAAESAIQDDDVEDSRPGFGRSVRRSFSKMTNARSLSRHSQRRQSLSSYNSRTTRTASPHRAEAVAATAQRSTATTQKTRTNAPAAPSLAANSGASGAGSVGGRLSSLAGRFRASSRGRASADKARFAGDPAQIYDANVVGESAEDIRAQMEMQERNADMLENVRACCDGKHDVGSLSHKGRTSFGNRLGGGGHAHAHPMSESMRSRT